MAATDRKRTYCLATLLAFALVGLAAARHADLERFYRAHVLPPLVASCNPGAPEWLEQIGTWARVHDVPGVQIQLRRKGQVFDCTFGHAITPRGTRRRLHHDTVLLYASLTKLFTSALVLQSLERSSRIYDLLDLHRVDLEHPDSWRTITIDMLLKHQGGFDRKVSGDPMLQTTPPCPADLTQLQNVSIDFQPGAGFAYSNLGYCLLGVALERSKQRSLDELLHQQILRPLRLDSVRLTNALDVAAWDTGPHISDATDEALFTSLNWRAIAASGGLAGTARDLGRFLHEIASGSLFASVGSAMLAPLPGCDDTRWRTCHGLALYSYRQPGRERMYWRDGSLPGATAFAAITQSGDVFVLLANSRKPAEWMSIHDELGQLIYSHLSTAEHPQPGSAGSIDHRTVTPFASGLTRLGEN